MRTSKSSIAIINLAKNKLDDESIPYLGDYIQGNLIIRYVFLSDNFITDRGVEVICEHLIGNVTFAELSLKGNNAVTDNSVPFLMDLVRKSAISTIYTTETMISRNNQLEILNLCRVPLNERDVPVNSSSKSASKVY